MLIVQHKSNQNDTMNKKMPACKTMYLNLCTEYITFHQYKGFMLPCLTGICQANYLASKCPAT